MANKCPICGAPLEGRACGYCGFKAPGGQTSKEQTGGGPWQYARQSEGDPYRDGYEYEYEYEYGRRDPRTGFDSHYSGGARPGFDSRYSGGARPGFDSRYSGDARPGFDSRYGGFYRANPRQRGYGDQDLYVRPISTRSKWVALILCFFFGVLGVHRFYVGKIGTGLLWLLTGGFFGIGWAVDLLMILTGSFDDEHGFSLRG